MMLSMTLLSGCVGEDLLRPLCMKNWVQHFPQAGVIHPYLMRKIRNGHFNFFLFSLHWYFLWSYWYDSFLVTSALDFRSQGGPFNPTPPHPHPPHTPTPPHPHTPIPVDMLHCLCMIDFSVSHLVRHLLNSCKLAWQPIPSHVIVFQLGKKAHHH